MATIRDVVEALARRGGVDAVVVVGRDGLPIDARAANGVDAENVAALLPSVINGLAQLGEAGGRGPFGTGVLELGSGLAPAAGPPPFPSTAHPAGGEDRILGEAEGLGAGLLPKPFSPSKLTARIAAMLGDSPPPPPPPPSVPGDTR